MRRKLLVVIGVMCFLLTSAIRGQSALAIRAAATNPVSGWQQMASPDPDRAMWVAPTNDLTAVDIERAEPVTGSDGSLALTVVFTDAGAKKMAALSATRIGQPIAFLLDGRLIWAPVVRARIEREAVLSGGPGGLTPDQVQRLLAILKQRL
jgi:preprotein translocase subunit SecD